MIFHWNKPSETPWLEEINILRKVLNVLSRANYFEYSIPRMGQRIDVVILIGPVIFVLEFKIGEKNFLRMQLIKLGLLAGFKELS